MGMPMVPPDTCQMGASAAHLCQKVQQLSKKCGTHEGSVLWRFCSFPPFFFESDRQEPGFLVQAPPHPRPLEWEIIVVDDCSKDNTADVVLTVPFFISITCIILLQHTPIF